MEKLDWHVKKYIYKISLIEYKNDKHLNKISIYDRRVYQYYEHMDMQNGQCANVVNPKPISAQNDDEYHNI